MYEAIVTETQELISAANVAKLQKKVEKKVPLPILPQFYEDWSPSKCVTYYIQLGYIKPYAGPEWFMALVQNEKLKTRFLERTKNGRTQIDFVGEQGELKIGACHIEVWSERNHCYLAFEDAWQNTLYKVAMTEESLRRVWVAMGQALGFDYNEMRFWVDSLPHVRLHVLPDQTEPIKDTYDPNKFNILQFINKLESGEIPKNFWADKDDDEDEE